MYFVIFNQIGAGSSYPRTRSRLDFQATCDENEAQKMQTPTSRSSIQDDRTGIAEALRSLDPRLRFAIGLLSCAVVAYYIPSIIIALTGVWVNNLTMINLLLISVAVLVLQNLVGNKVKRIFLVAVIFMIVFNAYATVLMLHMAANPTFHDWWMMFFFPTATCLLNAGMFLRFKAATGLN